MRETVDDQAPASTGTAVRVLAIGLGAATGAELEREAASAGIDLTLAADEAEGTRALVEGGWNAVVARVNGDEAPERHLEWWDELLRRLQRRPRLVGLTDAPSLALTMRAAELAGVEILPLPLRASRLRDTLDRIRIAARETRLPLPDVAPLAVGSCQVVAASAAMSDVYKRVAQAAPGTATVLVLGESGTGKELVARAIHEHGPRADKPFVAVNCAAIPETLLESELFGHEKGAFTGAVGRKVGRFERAHGGTLLLDEIGDMSLTLQARILRALQEREIEPVGATEAIPVDVRLIAATNRDLEELLSEGRFREDLYYRLAVVTIRLPRLVDREDDLMLLTAQFAREFAERCGKRITAVSDHAAAMLRDHDWVGNIRELRNVIERAVLLANGDMLRAEHLPEEWRRDPAMRDTSAPLALRDVEARHIARILDATGGQIAEAARILGIHRNTLARKIKEYDL